MGGAGDGWGLGGLEPGIDWVEMTKSGWHTPGGQNTVRGARAFRDVEAFFAKRFSRIFTSRLALSVCRPLSRCHLFLFASPRPYDQLLVLYL